MKQNKPSFIWQFKKLPFYWGSLETPNNGKNIPNSLPFCLHVEEKTGTLMQTPSKIVSDTLSIVYRKGSKFTGLMQNEGIGKKYADDFINFIKSSLKDHRINNMRILEIGCGTGYLLYRLKCMGADVIGLEPGAHGQTGANKYNVPIIKDFFPSTHIKDKFDLIIIYGVLEHIEKPVEFLGLLRKYLFETSYLVLSVPDCLPHMESGDISMLLHEHWSYFTVQTLKQTLRYAGGHKILIQNSDFGGTLYSIANMMGQNKAASTAEINSCETQAYNFRKSAQRSINRISNILEDAAGSGKTVGIYVPLRIINILSMLNMDFNLRFFDDNSDLHGTFFPGIDIPVEERNELLSRPTNIVMIMSNSFGKIIAKEIKTKLPSDTEILSWHEIFNLSALNIKDM